MGMFCETAQCESQTRQVSAFSRHLMISLSRRRKLVALDAPQLATKKPVATVKLGFGTKKKLVMQQKSREMSNRHAKSQQKSYNAKHVNSILNFLDLYTIPELTKSGKVVC